MERMRKLDCTSVDTSYESVTKLLDMDRTELEARFVKANEDEWQGFSYPELIRQFVFDNKEYTLPDPDVVCWFHTTRIAKDTVFEGGLKPTSEMRIQLVEMLADLAEEMNLCSKQEFYGLPIGGADGFRVATKCSSNGNDDGPHGFMVKEGMMSLYFEAPEFVREYCRSLDRKIGSPLEDEFKRRTIPAIVKFNSSFQTKGTLETALMYLLEKTQGKKKDFSNRGIGSRRHKVEDDDIESVEYL
jgi:hypothetical protein